MSIKLEVDSWDYRQAINKIDSLLKNIHCSCENSDIKNIDMPTATEIVDIVVDTII